MGIKIDIETNSADLIDKITSLVSKQLPFVTAKTLTGLAYDVRDEESKKIDQLFDVKTRWTNRSIKAVRAEKSHYPRSFSVVGIRDKVLAKNITGGTLDSSGGAFGVPGKETRDILNPGKRTLGPPRFPGRILKKKVFGNKPFIIKTRAGKEAIAVRETKRRKPIQILYTFKKSIKFQKRWSFLENAKRIVQQNYAKKFNRNLTLALR